MFVAHYMRQSCTKAPLSLPQLAVNTSKRFILCRIQSRCFSKSTSVQLASKKTPKARPQPKTPISQRPPSKPTTINSPPAQGPTTQYRSFADILALRSSPTLLYQSPSQVGFTVACYAFGGFCLAWAGWNFYATYLYAPEGLSKGISVGIGGACIAMTCFGTWLILGSHRIIHTINAIPQLSASGARTLSLRLESRPMLPFSLLKPRTIEVAPTDITLSSRVYVDLSQLSATQAAEMRKDQAKMREIEQTHLLTSPFRKMSYLTFRLFSGSRRVWTREGFVYVQVKDKNGFWKIDRVGGWALDDGRGIDRLVKHTSI